MKSAKGSKRGKQAKASSAKRLPSQRSSSRQSSTKPSPAKQPIEIHALVERNYASLRKIAQRSISVARAADTISPTSLVAESVIRLMKQRSLPTNSPHLCGLATILMAQAIADRTKLRRAQKRGRGQKPLPIPGDVVVDHRRGRTSASGSASNERTGTISTAEILRHLEVLGASIPRTMEVVTLHLVLGIPLERVAEMLSISERTAYRELLNGRERLAQRLLLSEGAP
ncbi:MAG: ECF-type sigma factor [Limnohabitans sp.]|nr:ECF-type sigma factor [Limnohabitans sp.]